MVPHQDPGGAPSACVKTSRSPYRDPGDQGYAAGTTVGFGEKLRIPAPFDITLDTSGLPLPR